MSLLANLGQTERRTGTLFGSSTAPPGGLFGQSQQQQQQQTSAQPAQSLFGTAPAAQQSGGLFGASQPQQTGGLFSQPQQQQQQQQPNLSNSLFGGRLQPAPSLNAVQAQSLQQSQQGLPQLRQSANAPFPGTSISGQRK